MHAAKVIQDPAEPFKVCVRALGKTALLQAENQVGEWRNCKVQEAMEQLARALAIPYPVQWEQTGEDIGPGKPGAIYQEVLPASHKEEYDEVVQRMQDSAGPGGLIKKHSFKRTIVKVERVVNFVGFAAYHRRCLTIASIERNKEKGANEIWLKHGTGVTVPHLICRGEGGLDFKYCESGMFGRAAYTAEDAVYSDSGYRHNLSGNQAQIILARAAVGSVKDDFPYGPDSRSLKEAPPGFDSVRGKVMEPDFFAVMLYNIDQGYPAYLVTYDTTC